MMPENMGDLTDEQKAALAVGVVVGVLGTFAVVLKTALDRLKENGNR